MEFKWLRQAQKLNLELLCAKELNCQRFRAWAARGLLVNLVCVDACAPCCSLYLGILLGIGLLPEYILPGASVVSARKWEEYNSAAHLSTPGERLEVNSCAFICDRQCGHECEQIFMELLPEPSSRQHRDGTVVILANQPSCRIPLAQGLCQVAVLWFVHKSDPVNTGFT